MSAQSNEKTDIHGHNVIHFAQKADKKKCIKNATQVRN